MCGRERRLVARHRERHAAVQDLLAEGLPVSEISRRLGLDRKTARKFARATSIEELLVKATNRAGILDPFKPYINQRWNDGITSAAVLHTELQAQGWKGSPQAVRRYVQQFRPADGRTPGSQDPAFLSVTMVRTWRRACRSPRLAKLIRRSATGRSLRALASVVVILQCSNSAVAMWR